MRRVPWQDLSLSSQLLWLNSSLLGDVNTIQELSNILSSGLADLADTGAALGESGVIVSFEDELVLDLGAWSKSDLGATKHGDVLVLLATQEVLDSD